MSELRQHEDRSKAFESALNEHVRFLTELQLEIEYHEAQQRMNDEYFATWRLGDNLLFRCNLCGFGSCDAVLTDSDPDRGLFLGDTYHFEHLPPNVLYWRVRKPPYFLNRPIAQ